MMDGNPVSWKCEVGFSICMDKEADGDLIKNLNKNTSTFWPTFINSTIKKIFGIKSSVRL